jgi:hypothetical protein
MSAKASSGRSSRLIATMSSQSSKACAAARSMAGDIAA